MGRTTYALTALPHKSQTHLRVINLRITKDRKHKHKSLGINIQGKNWDKKNKRVYRGEPFAEKINDQIQAVLLNAQIEKTILVGKKENSFIQYAGSIIDTTHTSNTKLSKSVALNKLKQYLKIKGLDDISFKDINNIFIDGYYSWLCLNLRPGTANEYIGKLNQLVDKTHRSGKYVWDVHPFFDFKKKRGETTIEVLDDEEINLLSNYEPRTKKEMRVKDSFFFMMHLSGIRVSDALKLTFNNFFVDTKDRLMVQYTITKTSRVMRTKVSVEALLYLVSSLKMYDNTIINDITKLYEEYLRVKAMLKVLEKDFYKIRIKSFGDVLKEFDADEVLEVLKSQSVLEREQDRLRDANQKCHFQIGHLEKWILDKGKTLIMQLKKTNPTDTVLPHLRGKYFGEAKMTTEQEKAWHSEKNSTNTTLKRIGKNLGIKKPISNHQSRHVFAMRLFLSGHNIHHISLALGHSSIAVTDAYRQKLVDDNVHDITDKFSDTFNDW